jgi:hypothetical protein
MLTLRNASTILLAFAPGAARQGGRTGFPLPRFGFARRPAAAGVRGLALADRPPHERGHDSEPVGDRGRDGGERAKRLLTGSRSASSGHPRRGWLGSPRGQHPGIGRKKGQPATTPRTTYAANSSGALRASERARWQGGVSSCPASPTAEHPPPPGGALVASPWPRGVRRRRVRRRRGG